MIKKLIRKLFGQDTDSAAIDTPAPKAPAQAKGLPVGEDALAEVAAWTDTGADDEAGKPRRKKPRADKRTGAAKAAGPDAPVILSSDIHGIDPTLLSRNAVRVTETLQQAGYRAFVVGGAVRDLLLGIAPKDFDVATDATPEQVQRLFRRARLIGRRFQIVHVQFGQEIIEVSTFRALVDAPKETPLGGAPKEAPLGGAPKEAPLEGAPTDTEVPPKRQRRDELERRTSGKGPSYGAHAVDASGRVLRDNVWGEQHEDATRRDFTINAMYYDPATQTVLDYHDGMSDIRARLLRMIGDPATRYREDPVRMLRVVRFSAKLGFDIEDATREPIQPLADLIHNVPAARLFDEMLKLLLSGQALACLKQLRAQGLHHGLLPLLDVVLEQPHGESFITLALNNTDVRVKAGKSVSPGFLFATLLWHDVQQRTQQYEAAGEYPVPALHHAMDDVLDMQTEKLAIHKRFSADMREIWGLQARLEKRSGRTPLKLVEHQRFRAGYDFLLLRCESGELDPAIGAWWTAFLEGNGAEREALLSQGGRERAPRKRRRRGGRSKGTDIEPAGAEPAQRAEED